MLRKIIFLTLFILLLTDSCLAFSKREKLKSPAIDISAAQIKFSFKLINEISRNDPDANLFISPLSIQLALAMVLNGTDTDTFTEIQRTLELEDYPLPDINASYQELSYLISELDPEVKIEIANSIWYQEDFQILPSYVQKMKTHYRAAVSGIDFNSPQAVEQINNWVAKNTHEKIRKIIEPPLLPTSIAFIINAVYFNGTWETEFDRKKTHPENFLLQSGEHLLVPMMKREDDFSYFENEFFQAVELNYGNGSFSTIIFLPKPDQDLNTILKLLTLENWITWKANFITIKGFLQIPKLKLEYDIILNDILKSLGMRSAFDINSADFSRISSQDKLAIDEVIHKTYVDINEEGTEAAAVTSVGLKAVSIPKPGFIMKVDHPYLLIIKNDANILFIGKILEPKYE